MPLIQKIPRRLEEVLGPEGTDQFVDFLNVALDAQKNDVVQLVSDRFEKVVAQETGKLRIDMAALDAKIANLRAELKGDIAGLDTKIAGLDTKIAGLDTKIADLRAGLKSDITAQTKWIVVTFLGVAAFISIVLPFMWKLADKIVR